MSEQKKSKYDDEPVLYCANCLSLNIKHEDAVEVDYCADCGCCDITETSIELWEKRYALKYGHKYVEATSDPKKSHIFKLPIDKLMEKVFNSSKWEFIIRSIFSKFPKGLSKTDSILVFFDKLSKTNKIDDLRMLLFKMNL